MLSIIFLGLVMQTPDTRAMRISFSRICGVWLIAALFFVGVAGAQQAGVPQNTGSCSGTVIDARTAQPLSEASVVLHTARRFGASASTSTSTDGRFVFHGIAAGQYRITASRQGYGDSSDRHEMYRGDSTIGVSCAVGPGQQIDGLTLRLIPMAIIEGQIANERDEPMSGVFVQALKPSYHDGRREYSIAHASFTDEHGEFRINGLAPGQYYLKATKPRSTEKGGAALVYVPSFYPGVADPSLGQAVEVQGGQEMQGIRLAMSPSATFHVRGRILSTKGGLVSGAEVTLSQFAGDGYTIEVETDKSGKYEVAAAPAGNYSIVAQSPFSTDSSRSATGSSNVTVGDSNVNVPDITVFPGATISGHLKVEGNGKFNAGRTRASLRPVTSLRIANYVGSTEVEPDGTFVFYDVPDGNYRIQLSLLPDGFYIRGTGDGSDSSVVVTQGHAGPVEVTVAQGAGKIQGQVYKNKDNDEAADSVLVVLVPDVSRRTQSDFYRFSTSDQSGRFVLRNISPGDYSLFAWQDIQRDAFMNPDFIRQYEDAGQAIHVEEGDNLSVTLHLAIQP